DTHEGLASTDLPLTLAPRDRSSALSFGQERIWFFEQLEPGTAAYTMPAAVRFRGALDRDALERSLREVVRRHEALRTMFVSEAGGPVQIVLPAADLPVTYLDLAGTSLEAR